MTVEAYDANTATAPLQAMDINRRVPGTHNVQIDIAFCAVCHSDIHQVRAEWAGTLYRRLPPLARLTMVASFFLALLPTIPAFAHHGWAAFETDRLVYIAGTVSSQGVWGNPHSQFDVTLARNPPAQTPKLAIPEQLQDPQDSIRVTAAPSYKGPHQKLEVIIAPPAWSGRWGLGRALKIGERFQAVGYINRTDDGLFRPVVFWYGEDAVPVNQVLGNTLPFRAPLLNSGRN